MESPGKPDHGLVVQSISYVLLIYSPGGKDGEESAWKVGDMGQEDPLKMQMATHCNILVWRIP